MTGFRLALNADVAQVVTNLPAAIEVTKRRADIAVDAAKRLAPRDSGRLADGIHYEMGQDDAGPYADISYARTQYYGGFVELGTAAQPPHPYLRPALDA